MGGYLNSCIRRCYQLVVPYLIWSVLAFLLRGDYTVENLFNIAYMPDNYFWFLWVLFGICVLFSGARTLSARLNVNEMVFILISCVVLLALMVMLEIRVFGFQFLSYYFLFYTAGYCIHKYEASLLRFRRPGYIIGLLCLWLILAWEWTMHGLPGWMPAIPHVPASLLQYIYRGFTALTAVIVLLLTAPYITDGKNGIIRAICFLGDVSLGLYVIHLTIIGYISRAVDSVADFGSAANVILIFIITSILSIITVRLLRNYRHTARWFLGKI